jgi:hypothetical protein
MIDLHIDALEMEQLQRALAGLDGTVQAKVVARALRRAAQMARTQVVRRASEQSDMPFGEVRRRTIVLNAGGSSSEIVMRSGWWPLYKLGGAHETKPPKLTKKQIKERVRQPRSTGVIVRSWGHHRGAFIAGMRSGHKGVFIRTSGSRLPIRELWGPNPASFVNNHPAEYEAILADVQRRVVVPRIMHEIARAMSTIRV